MIELQTIVDVVKNALMREGEGVFGRRVYADRTRPFQPDKATSKILPAVNIYVPQITFSTEGKVMTRGRFSTTAEYIILEVWSRIDATKYKVEEPEKYEEAQGKALRLTVDAVISILFRSNEFMSLFGEITRLDIKYGADLNTQARSDAATIAMTGTNRGVFSVCPQYNAVPLKSLFLNFDIKNDPNERAAVEARFEKLDEEE